ncbi:MAG: DMT family transporter [Maritimibacter sp.]|nr:DMT family transporter [Maritimibacter sp.]
MNNLRGALLMMLAMAGFAAEDAFVKTLSATMPMGQVLIYLGAGGGLGFALIATRRGHCVLSRSFFHPMVILRNFGEIVGTAGYVTAIALVPLSLASSLLQTMPLFVSLGAILFFGEQVGWRRWLAIVIGLAGVLVILRPGLEGFDPKALFALGGALALAARDLATRHCPTSVHPLQLSTWGFLMVIPIGMGMLAFSDGPVRIGTDEGLLLAGALALGMIGYHALTLAMQTGEVGFVTPFRYTRLVLAFVIGWLLFGERPDQWMFLGAAIVVGAGTYTLLRERRATRRARVLEAAAP